ncbi:MAG TPA: tRNA uridine-5-carboxymethylaminomethyl(34) synthesis GTPase MnmE, partial [Gammaproteobacteria bacterium]|nr:tRNA uridine-5-carboxymethylaminomethyl(34) synthesis GTPase MnmE [Gammaproteobacteria bacterium]
QAAFSEIQTQAQQGRLLQEGMRVVIAGEPNVGKSSLLNSLTGSDSAIVADIPGTTRDILTEQIHIDGMPLHIIDTAGLRESDDPVEQEGIRRARAQMDQADRVLVLSAHGEASAQRPAGLRTDIPLDFVVNKIDLQGQAAKLEETNAGVRIYLSAKTHVGVDLLKSHLKRCMGFDASLEGTFIARRRHLNALATTATHVDRALSQLRTARAGELCAEELRYAQEALNEITGEFTSDDLLGEIFKNFCIGK